MAEKFNPSEHLRTLTRRKKVKDTTGEHWITENHCYLDVKFRIIWFRSVYPDGFIQTVETEVTDQFARIEATAYDKDPAQGGKKLGMGRRLVYAADFKDYVEKAETQAIGRALAVAGFGTQFCEEFDEEDTFADAPVESKSHSGQGAVKPAVPVKLEPPVKPVTPVAPSKPDSKNGIYNGIYSGIYPQVYDAAKQKGLSMNDTDLLVTAKYQKLSMEELSKAELEEFLAGIKTTPADKLRDFLDRYKASRELKNIAVA